MTTAASVWVAAAIGLRAGLGFWAGAISATLIFGLVIGAIWGAFIRMGGSDAYRQTFVETSAPTLTIVSLHSDSAEADEARRRMALEADTTPLWSSRPTTRSRSPRPADRPGADPDATRLQEWGHDEWEHGRPADQRAHPTRRRGRW